MMIRCSSCMHTWEEGQVPTVKLKSGHEYEVCPFCLTDEHLVEIKPNLSMDDIYSAKIPGFYRDERGAYCIMIGKYLISCNINEITGEYDVCIDILTSDGPENVEWSSFIEADKALDEIKDNIDFVINVYMKEK